MREDRSIEALAADLGKAEATLAKLGYTWHVETVRDAIKFAEGFIRFNNRPTLWERIFGKSKRC